MNKQLVKLKNWKSPYLFYYKVTDADGKKRFESIYQQDCLDFISKKFQDTQVLLSMEQIKNIHAV